MQPNRRCIHAPLKVTSTLNGNREYNPSRKVLGMRNAHDAIAGPHSRTGKRICAAVVYLSGGHPPRDVEAAWAVLAL
jgi:hypothetical protein